MSKFKLALDVVTDFGALAALCRWPLFSLTSYRIVNRLLRQGINPATIIDVGANQGQFTVAAAKLFPNAKIHAYEPLPDCVDKLRRVTARLPQVRLYDYALGESEGIATFNKNAYPHASSFLALAPRHKNAFPNAQVESQLDVRIAKLDDELDNLAAQGPILLKLDVQGFEAHVLRGAILALKRIDWVVLEMSFEAMYESETLFTELTSMLDSYGFEFERIVGCLTEPGTGVFVQVDGLFVRRSRTGLCGSS